MEQQTKHTPGPWKLSSIDPKQILAWDEPSEKTGNTYRKNICICNTEEDAKLIANAPTTAAERDSLKKDVAELVEQRSRYKSEIANIEIERDKLKEELREEWEHVAKLNIELSKLKEENERLTKENQGLEKGMDDLSEGGNNHRREVIALRESNKSLVEALRKTTDELRGFGGDKETLKVISESLEILKKVE